MISIKKRFGISDKKLQFIIEDFLEHLEASGIDLMDSEDNHKFSEGFIIENYFATFGNDK